MLELTLEQEKLFKQYYPAAIKLASTSGSDFGNNMSLALIALCKSVKAYQENFKAYKAKECSFSTFYHKVFYNMLVTPYYKGQYYGDDKYENIDRVAMHNLKRNIVKLRKSIKKLDDSNTESNGLLQKMEEDLRELMKNKMLSFNYSSGDIKDNPKIVPELIVGTTDNAEDLHAISDFKEYAKQILSKIKYDIMLLSIDGYSGNEIANKLNISPANVRVIKHRFLPKIEGYFK